LAALGGACRKGLPFDSLMAIGRVHEFMGSVTDALDCYGLAIDGAAAVTAERKRRAWERLASAATGLAAGELGRFRPSLELALKAQVPLAALSLARIAESENDWTQATTLVRAFLDGADADDPRLVEARALQARVGKVIESEIEQGNRRSERIRVLVALLVVASLVGLFARRRYRQPISRALRSQPLLFPVLTQAIGQIRHDVLKHRASALELLADPTTNSKDVARALLEPEPASTMVASIYQHLAQEARGLGLRLCTLTREPVFGPLIADLSRAESLLQQNAPASIEDLRAIDERLRGMHADRLQELLLSGPRTTVDAGLLARWIDAMTNEPGRGSWTAPQLNLKDAETFFPLPESTLSSIFSNLLRNAIAAATDEPNAAVEVRVEQSRDSMGKRMVSLLIADSSSQPLEVADLDNRPADRGLGIVREATRAWGGEIIAHDEPAPFRKVVGVRFAAPAEAKP
jgi:signal transduction histidine kinase